ncbi:hypothetical protein WJX84_011287 [Apatococcus fuscideae]|uniref:Uncharacterized protein n=1 Tax=Apatococcus fuscideae TaxID=2026836 RepID=A0AAW1SR21_9CHLO
MCVPGPGVLETFVSARPAISLLIFVFHMASHLHPGDDGSEVSTAAEAGGDDEDDGTWEPDKATPWKRGPTSRSQSRSSRLSSSSRGPAWGRAGGPPDSAPPEGAPQGQAHWRQRVAAWQQKRDALVQDFRDCLGLGLMSDIPMLPAFWRCSRLAGESSGALPPDSLATPTGVKTTGGEAPAEEEQDGGTPRGAAEQAVMQARLAVVTALNSESKEGSFTPAAQYYIKQHAEAVKRTQALRQKLNGRLNQAVSPVKQSTATAGSRAPSGPPSPAAAQPPSGPPSPSIPAAAAQPPSGSPLSQGSASNGYLDFHPFAFHPGDLTMNAAKAAAGQQPGPGKTPASSWKHKQMGATPASARAPFVPSSKGGWL